MIKYNDFNDDGIFDALIEHGTRRHGKTIADVRMCRFANVAHHEPLFFLTPRKK